MDYERDRYLKSMDCFSGETKKIPSSLHGRENLINGDQTIGMKILIMKEKSIGIEAVELSTEEDL